MQQKVSIAEMINFLLLTYDSCRYDVWGSPNTPGLDSHRDIYRAEVPANLAFGFDQAFFVGLLPNVNEYISDYKR